MSEPKWTVAAMLDVARVTERLSYYRSLIPRLADWGYDTLFWHFTDDQGCALKLKSHPELASRYALSRKETESLIRLADRHGIEVIPEVESLGHTLYITHLKKYRRLFEGSRRHFNAICPSDPASLEILRDVLAETAEVFPSPWLHVGLDEVQFDDACPRCRKRGLPQWRLFADHVTAVHDIVTGLGKRTILWGDHLVKDPRIARRVPRGAVVAHWDYFISDKLAGQNSALVDLGFKVLCSPAAARVFVTVMPDETNLANIRQFAQIAHRHRRRGVVGLVNTVWCPERQLGTSTHWALALGAALFADPKADEQKAAMRFLKRDFGLARPAAAARALRLLHEASPGLLFLRKVLVDDPRTHKHRLDITDVDEAGVFRDGLSRARKALAAAQGRVTRNKREFDTWLVAAELLDEMLSRAQLWQDVAVLDRLRRTALDQRDVALARDHASHIADLLGMGARQALASARTAERHWKFVRYADDPRRFGRDGYVRSQVALPGLLARTAETLARTAARAKRIARTGRGSLGLPENFVALR